jgi:excisionase family DNA binding protein
MLALSRAARRLGVAYPRIRAAVQSGELPAYRLGERNIRVLWGEVVEWLRSSRVSVSPIRKENAIGGGNQVLERERAA